MSIKVNTSAMNEGKLPETVNADDVSNTAALSKDFSAKLGRPVKVSVSENNGKKEVNVLEFVQD